MVLDNESQSQHDHLGRSYQVLLCAGKWGISVLVVSYESVRIKSEHILGNKLTGLQTNAVSSYQ